MGVNQSHQGVKTAQAIINLALMTGNIGRPGTGANSITGQCNAMGSRLFSNTTNLLGGHDFANPDHRAKVAACSRSPKSGSPTAPSWAYDQIIDGIEAGKIRGLWVIGTNPAHSWINQGRLRDILGRLDFLVVQDMYHSTETAQLADLLLPAAGWGEKEGTFINSERRIGLIKKVRRAPGQALADFHIFKLVAHYYGCDAMFAAWESPEAVFQILKQLSAGMPCDITGIADYQMLDEAARHPVALPGRGRRPRPATAALRRRPFLPPGRPRPVPLRGAAADPRAAGRRVSVSAPDRPRQRRPVAHADADGQVRRPAKAWPQGPLRRDPSRRCRRAWACGPASGWSSNRAGARHASGRSSPRPCPRGNLFLPMHDGSTNRLTDAVFDPESRQPAYKACAARVRAGPRRRRLEAATTVSTTTIGSRLE